VLDCALPANSPSFESPTTGISHKTKGAIIQLKVPKSSINLQLAGISQRAMKLYSLHSFPPGENGERK